LFLFRGAAVDGGDFRESDEVSSHPDMTQVFLTNVWMAGVLFISHSLPFFEHYIDTARNKEKMLTLTFYFWLKQIQFFFPETENECVKENEHVH
jgi:hypothetical protein